MPQKTWRLAAPAQPLVFCFAGVSPLCCAVARLYRGGPRARASLCLYRGRYYLAVYAGLRQRPRVLRAVGRCGACLGAARVLYAFCEEHGRPISANAVAELGAALDR